MSPPPGFVLLDVEGTTTPVDFVFQVLFPDARDHVESFLEAHGDDAEVAGDLAGLHQAQILDLAEGHDPPAWDGSQAAAAAYARWLIDRDRKLTALKSLQGKIWAEGYAEGRLRGQVYEDVPRAFARWAAAGWRVATFSSGSILAQKLIFEHSDRGDLTAFLSGHFDTRTGPKGEAASYRRIASALGQSPRAGLFVSDVVAELDAARAAGFDTALALRNPREVASSGHRTIATFDELP